MADIEKVLQGLKCCTECKGESCRKCPYAEEMPTDTPMCMPEMASDAMHVIHDLQAEQKKIVHCKECRYNCWEHGHETPSFWTPCREIKPEGNWFCWCGAAKDGEQE